MLNQVDLLKDEDNYEIYTGMLKSMAINALKKSAQEYYSAWTKFLHKQ